MLLCNAERIPEREQLYVGSMLARGIQGVILGSPLSLKHIAGMTKRGMKVVAFDRLAADSAGVELDRVRVDHALGARFAIAHLLDLGIGASASFQGC